MENELFRFASTTEVRWRDLDAMRHVNNAVYFTYMEQGRVHYLREMGLVPDDPGDIGFILAEARCQFRSPLMLGEQVTIRIRVSKLGHSSFVFEYRLEGEDGRLAAEAHTTQVFYDYQKGRAVPLSSDWRRAIASYEPGLPTEAP